MSVASVIKRALALKCFMCTETLKNPVALPCGHSICLACWRAATPHCPVCGDSSAPQHVAPNEIIAAAVEALGEGEPYCVQAVLEPGDITTDNVPVATGLLKGRVGSKTVAIKTITLPELSLSDATRATFRTVLSRAHVPGVPCLCPSAACGVFFDVARSAILLTTPLALGNAETLLAKAAENEDAAAAAASQNVILPSGLSVEDLVKVALAPARGLAALHARGKVHGNVCARNVLLLPAAAVDADVDADDGGADGSEGAASGGGAADASAITLWPVGSEGVASVLSDAGFREALASLPEMPMPGAGAGGHLAPSSAVYAAPEQGGGGDGQGSPAADVYAFGVLLAALATGRRGADLKASAAAAAAGHSGTLPDAVPAALRRLVGRCCDPDPLQRPTAREATAQLLLLGIASLEAGLTPPWRLVGMAPSLPARAPPGRPAAGDGGRYEKRFAAAVADASAGGYGEHDVVAVAEEPALSPGHEGAAAEGEEAAIWVARESGVAGAPDGVVLVHGSRSGRPLRAVVLPLGPGCLAAAPDRRLWRVHCRAVAFSPCGDAAFVAVYNELAVDPMLAAGSPGHAARLDAARAPAHQVLVLGLRGEEPAVAAVVPKKLSRHGKLCTNIETLLVEAPGGVVPGATFLAAYERRFREPLRLGPPAWPEGTKLKDLLACAEAVGACRKELRPAAAGAQHPPALFVHAPEEGGGGKDGGNDDGSSSDPKRHVAMITLRNGERVPLVALPLLGCLALPNIGAVSPVAWASDRLRGLHVYPSDDDGPGCSLLVSRGGLLARAHFASPGPRHGGGGGGGHWEGAWTTGGLPKPLRAPGWERWALLPAAGLLVRLDTGARELRVYDLASGAPLGAVPVTGPGEPWSGVAALPPGVHMPGNGDRPLLILTTKNTAEIVRVARKRSVAGGSSGVESEVLGSLFSWSESDAPSRPQHALRPAAAAAAAEEGSDGRRCCTAGAACCMRDGATAYLPSLRAVALSGSCGYGRTYPCMAFCLPQEPPQEATSAAGPTI